MDLSHWSLFEENTAFRDGGAVFFGPSTSVQVDSVLMRQNSVECPTKPYGVTVCPEWKDTTVGIAGTLDAFCIHPSCQAYTGGGGAMYVDEALGILIRRSTFEKNKAPQGGAVFVRNTLNFNVVQNSSFTYNSCERSFALVNIPDYKSGGGAVYFQLSRFLLLDTRPLVRNTAFVGNSVNEGSGGAVFWEVIPPMIPQLKAAGGLVRFESGYGKSVSDFMSNQSRPLAHDNSASWGGQFIGSSAFSLVIIDGPARYAGSFVGSSTPCGSNVCPFHCSGDKAVKGQQCVSRSMAVETLAKPATVRGGFPIADAVGAKELRVAVVDFYNSIVESASETVFVEAAVNFANAGLGNAYPGKNSTTNCTEQGWTGNLKRPEICSYLLSPATVAVGAVEGSSASQAAVKPVRGIAVFSDLMLHAEPSNICYKKVWVSDEPGAVEGEPVIGQDLNVARRRLQLDPHSLELEATTRPGPRKRKLRDVHARDELPRFRSSRRHLAAGDVNTMCTPKLYDLVVTSVGNVGALVEGKPELAHKIGQAECTGCETGLFNRKAGATPEYYKYVDKDDKDEREFDKALANGESYWLKANSNGAVAYRERKWDLITQLSYNYKVNKLHVDKNGIVTAWHRDTYLNPPLRAGATVTISGFVQSSWANSDWVVIGKPNATSFQFSVENETYLCDVAGFEHRDIVKTVTLTSTAALQVDSDGVSSLPSAVGLKGTFVLSVNGEKTESLEYDASANNVKSALENLKNVGNVNVSREGDGGPEGCDSSCMYGFRWDITFHNEDRQKQRALKAFSNVTATENQLLCSIRLSSNEIRCAGAYDDMVILKGKKVRFSRGNQSFELFTSEDSRERDHYDVSSGRKSRVLLFTLSSEEKEELANRTEIWSKKDSCDDDEFPRDDGNGISEVISAGWSASVVEVKTSSHTIFANALSRNWFEDREFKTAGGVMVTKKDNDWYTGDQIYAIGVYVPEGGEGIISSVHCAKCDLNRVLYIAGGLKSILTPTALASNKETGHPIVATGATGVNMSTVLPLVLDVSVQKMTDLGVYRHAVVSPEGIPVDVLWLFGEQANPGTDSWLLHSILHKDTFDGGKWPLLVVNYNVPHAGTWDTEDYSHPKWEIITGEWDREMPDITVALLPNDRRVPAMMEVDSKAYFKALRISLSKMEPEISVDKHNRDILYMVCEILTTGNMTSSSKSKLLMSSPCDLIITNASFNESRQMNEGCLTGDKSVASANRRQLSGLDNTTGSDSIASRVASSVHSNSSATHLQTVALLLNFDLNWNTNLLDFFSMAGYISAIGEGLIPTGCYLGYHSHELPFAPFYITSLIFIALPFVLMIPGILYLTYNVCMIRWSESSSGRRDNRLTRHLVTVLKHIKIKEMKKELADKDGDGKLTEEEAREAKVQRAVRAGNRKRTRKEYNTLIHALQKASAEDKKLHHEGNIDHLAIGRMKARELVYYVRSRKINLASLFKEFQVSHSGPKKRKKRLVEVHSPEFLLILKTMNLGWTEEEYMDIVELLSMPGRIVGDPRKESNNKSRLKRSNTARRGEPRVVLNHIMAFETTLVDKIIVMITVICFILYPTIARKIFQAFACYSGLMDGDANYYLNSDLDIDCFSVSHISFITTVCLPVIIGYIIGFPTTMIYLIWRSKKRFGRLSEKTQFRYAVFISGYSKRFWFWEGVTSARKVLLIVIAVFLGSYGPERQFFFASLLLVCTCVVQLHAKPFENLSLNALETSGVGFLWLTVYFGIFFYWELLSNSELNWLGFFIVFMNVSFVWWAMGYLIGEYLALHPEARWIQNGILAPAWMTGYIDSFRKIGTKRKTKFSWKKKKSKQVVDSSRTSSEKSARRRICSCMKTKNPFYLIVLSVPTLMLLILVSMKKVYGRLTGCCAGGKSSGKVGDKEMVDHLELMQTQIKHMKEAIGLHIKEMKELALKKEKEMYKAKLKMLNIERMREQKLRDEQEALKINTRKKESFDSIASSGVFAHKVAIIRRKRELREEREKRNEELRQMGIQAPTEEDDGLYDFLNGGLLDQVIEAGGDDDELISTDANNDEELQELFNFGGASEGVENHENEGDDDEVDLDSIFSAPKATITPNLETGGFDLDATDSEDSEEDAREELDTELLFLDDKEKEIAIKNSEKERAEKKKSKAEAREAELLARIRELEEGITKLSTEEDLDNGGDAEHVKVPALEKAKELSKKLQLKSNSDVARRESTENRSKRSHENSVGAKAGSGSDLDGLLSALDEHIVDDQGGAKKNSRKSLGSRILADTMQSDDQPVPRPARLPAPTMAAVSGKSKFCGNCGEKQAAESMFCGSCGSRL
eukprot:g4258.t1